MPCTRNRSLVTRAAALALAAGAITAAAGNAWAQTPGASTGPPLQRPLVQPQLSVDVDPVAEAEEARTVQLGLPQPARYAPTSPARATAAALLSWHDRAWDRLSLWLTDSPLGVDFLLRHRLEGFSLGAPLVGDGSALVPAELVVHDTWLLRTGRRQVLLRLDRDGADGPWVVRRKSLRDAARAAAAGGSREDVRGLEPRAGGTS